MACTKSEVLDTVKEYGAANNRPIPKRDVIAKHGEDGLTHLKALVEDGTIGCRRGRNGGYFFKSEDASPVTDAPNEAENAPPSDSEASGESNDLAEQFAALEAKLARLSESESEAAPF
jgi:hypothetical protein